MANLSQIFMVIVLCCRNPLLADNSPQNLGFISRQPLFLQDPNFQENFDRHEMLDGAPKIPNGSLKGVSGITGRPESVRGGMRSWMQARAVPVVSTRIAGLLDLFRSSSKPGKNNSVSTIFSVASLLIECC